LAGGLLVNLGIALLFAADRSRKVLVLRQFHQEGFVNLYSLRADLGEPKRLVFESAGFENFDNRWKARETYDWVSPDELVETFELAGDRRLDPLRCASPR
jgi:hypothetical protein